MTGKSLKKLKTQPFLHWLKVIPASSDICVIEVVDIKSCHPIMYGDSVNHVEMLVERNKDKRFRQK